MQFGKVGFGVVAIQHYHYCVGFSQVHLWLVRLVFATANRSGCLLPGAVVDAHFGASNGNTISEALLYCQSECKAVGSGCDGEEIACLIFQTCHKSTDTYYAVRFVVDFVDVKRFACCVFDWDSQDAVGCRSKLYVALFGTDYALFYRAVACTIRCLYVANATRHFAFQWACGVVNKVKSLVFCRTIGAVGCDFPLAVHGCVAWLGLCELVFEDNIFVDRSNKFGCVHIGCKSACRCGQCLCKHVGNLCCAITIQVGVVDVCFHLAGCCVQLGGLVCR